MNTIKKTLTVLILCGIILCNVNSTVNAKNTSKDYSKSIYNKTRWQTIKNDYLKTKTDRLIFVKYKTGSKATVEMWKKIPKSTEPASSNISPNDNTDILTDKDSFTSDNTGTAHESTWKRIVSCNAYVGKNGLGKKRQGDRKTPVGIYNITMAFGRRKSPGTAGISYTKLNKYHYWSTERDTYNTFVDVRTLGRKWMSGEHLISYNPWYNYALAMDYNKKCTYLKGSAIFLHCTGKGRTYTMGCIAVSEKNMKRIVKNTTKHTKIFIYKRK